MKKPIRKNAKPIQKNLRRSNKKTNDLKNIIKAAIDPKTPPEVLLKLTEDPN